MLNGQHAGDLRILPRLAAVDAEQYTLGAALISRKACLRVLETIDAGDLEYSSHQLIFDGIRSLWTKRPSERIDSYTLKVEMQALGTLERAGGELYLMQLESLADPGGLDTYLRDIKRFSGLRFLRELAEGLLVDVTPDADPETLTAGFTTLLLARKSADRGQPVTMAQAGRAEWERLQRREKVETLKYGIPSLDAVAGGIAGGEMGFLGARPGAGKTALALRLLMNGGLAWGPMLFLSLEMKEASVVRREFARLTGLTYQQLREVQNHAGNTLSDGDLRELATHLEAFWPAAERVWIDTHSHQLSQLVARCHRMVLTEGIRGVVVDYGQLVQDDRGRKNQSKTEEVMRVVRALKNEVAMPLNIPVLCIAAVNRDVEKRGQGERRRGGEEKRPALLQMSDLGWSSELEAVAEQIIFLNPDPTRLDTPEGVRHLLVGVEKNRNGGKGIVPLQFDAPRFDFRAGTTTYTDEDAPPERTERESRRFV